ncbi:hypothetical protein [Stenoxybacter acetivorans]|uniref:hypothetical protein n=1 Tax=Stenoxybacter acetivorans TaxID=422441 RepID=UPI00055DAA3C|nr:hypothetical protein [Stenoxybacter acetivorans]
MGFNFTGMSAKEMATETRVKHDQWIEAVAQADSRFLAENRPCVRAHDLAQAVLTWATDNADKYKGLSAYDDMIQKATAVDTVYEKIVDFREKALFLDAVVAIKKELPQTAEKAMAAVEAMGNAG